MAYNSIINKVRDIPDVEGLILLHDDMEVLDNDLLNKLSRAFSIPDVAIVGAVGAINVSTLAWWLGEVRGVMQDTQVKVKHTEAPHEVDTLDGCFLALSPWAINNIKFDSDGYSGFHGYDADICFSARAAGKKVMWEQFDLFHHSKGGVGNVESWAGNNDVFRAKWVLDAPKHNARSVTDKENPVMLHIGINFSNRQGWSRLEDAAGVDSPQKLPDQLPWSFEDSSVDAIFANNALQKVATGLDRINFMNECWRILKPGASIEIVVPRFPSSLSIADPTNMSLWLPESFSYFTGNGSVQPHDQVRLWKMEFMLGSDFEIRAILVKPNFNSNGDIYPECVTVIK